MRIRACLFLAVVLLLMVTTGACHSPEPRDEGRDTADLPGLKVPLPDDDDAADDNRPSLGEDESNLRAELTDATPRFSYEGLRLRMDRGGVLFTAKADGTWCITDLDGASMVEVNPDRSTLSVDGRRVSVSRVTLLREYGGVSWYELEAGARATLVVESL